MFALKWTQAEHLPLTAVVEVEQCQLSHLPRLLMAVSRMPLVALELTLHRPASAPWTCDGCIALPKPGKQSSPLENEQGAARNAIDNSLPAREKYSP